MRENIITYSNFLSDYIYDKFGALDGEVLCSDLGISENDFSDILKNKSPRLSKQQVKSIKKMIKKLEKEVKNEVVLRKLIGRIIFSCNFGDSIDVSDKCFLSKIKNGNVTYSSEIYFTDDRISAFASGDDCYSNVFYKRSTDGFTIKYDEKNTKTYNPENLDKTYFDVTNVKTTKSYDKKGFQVFDFNEEIRQNYIKHKSGYIEFPEFSPFENFNRKTYSWKIDDFILVKELENHVLSDSDDEFIDSRDGESNLIGINPYVEDKEMSRPHYLFGITKDVLDAYVKGEISIDEVWKQTRPKYRTMEEFTIY